MKAAPARGSVRQAAEPARRSASAYGDSSRWRRRPPARCGSRPPASARWPSLRTCARRQLPLAGRGRVDQRAAVDRHGARPRPAARPPGSARGAGRRRRPAPARTPTGGSQRRGGASTSVRPSLGASAVIIASSASSRCSASRGPPAGPRFSAAGVQQPLHHRVGHQRERLAAQRRQRGDAARGAAGLRRTAPPGSDVGSSTTALAPCATASSSAVSVSAPSGGQATSVDGRHAEHPGRRVDVRLLQPGQRAEAAALQRDHVRVPVRDRDQQVPRGGRAAAGPATPPRPAAPRPGSLRTPVTTR